MLFRSKPKKNPSKEKSGTKKGGKKDGKGKVNVVMEESQQNSANFICYKCGKAGHTATICKTPPEQVKAFQKKFQAKVLALQNKKAPPRTANAVQDEVECEEEGSDDDVWGGCLSSNANTISALGSWADDEDF